MEIDQKVTDVKVPGLRAVDAWTFARAGEDIVQDNVERDAGEFSDERTVDDDLNALFVLAISVRRLLWGIWCLPALEETE